MKNVLLITYHFPPDAGVGAFRCQKFAKYLPEYGWTPHVLTVSEHYHSQLDPSGLADVGAGQIFRTRMLPSPLATLLAVRTGLLHALGRGRYIEQRREANTLMTFEQREQPDGGLRDGLRRLAVSVARLPDDQIGWLLPAVLAGRRVCHQHAISALLTSGPPQSTHLIGLWLKRLVRLPWVADFRDPWVGNPGKPLASRSAVSDRVEARMERRVVQRADRVVLLSDRSREALIRRYPDQPANKFITIHNGFDVADFAPLTGVTPDAAFTVAHVGTLYFRRSPRAFLTALRNLVEAGKIPKATLQIVFAGVVEVPDVAAHAASGPLSGAIRITGSVSHREALSWMRRADLLCLFAQGQGEQIPAKAFEYLASGTPILAITAEGATADLVTKAGGSVAADEPWPIEDAVYQQYLKYRSGHRPGGLERPWTRDEVRPYDRRVLTGRLAALLWDRM